MLGGLAIFMMANNKEQRVCVKFCFLLGTVSLCMQDNINMDIVTGWELHSACLRHDAMAGRFENCNELSDFIPRC
jgi:hypothetical protein